MRKIAMVIGLIAFGALLHKHFERKKSAVAARTRTVDFSAGPEDLLPEREEPRASRPSASESQYTCDGRKRCPQMHSCKEAMWFLQHCPGMEMDGDGDGIPCENQFCSHLR